MVCNTANRLKTIEAHRKFNWAYILGIQRSFISTAASNITRNIARCGCPFKPTVTLKDDKVKVT